MSSPHTLQGFLERTRDASPETERTRRDRFPSHSIRTIINLWPKQDALLDHLFLCATSLQVRPHPTSESPSTVSATIGPNSMSRSSVQSLSFHCQHSEVWVVKPAPRGPSVKTHQLRTFTRSCTSYIPFPLLGCIAQHLPEAALPEGV